MSLPFYSMNTYFSKIFKIKPDKEHVFFDWMEEIHMRKEEAVKTFEYEGVRREVFVTFKNPGGDTYVVGFNEALEAPKKSDKNVEINRKHAEIMRECLEPISERGTVVLDLSSKLE